MTLDIRTLTGDELGREIAHARNRRDAFAAGREPAEVLTALRELLDEQTRRREARRQYDDALDNYGERLAEAGSSAFMLYGNSADAMTVARSEVGPEPRPEDFGLVPEPPRPAPAPAPVDPSDIPF
jgi:hypothetical protein